MASFASSATTGGTRKHAWTNLVILKVGIQKKSYFSLWVNILGKYRTNISKEKKSEEVL